LPVWLFAGSVLLFLPIALFDLRVFDEGFIVTGAMMVGDGAIPLRDFFSLYGPGQYWLTALLFWIFDESLGVSRVAHAGILAALCAVLYRATSIATRDARALSLGATAVFAAVTIIANPNAGYPPISSTLLLLVAAILFSNWATRRRALSLALASSVCGAAGLFRWDMGTFGLVALNLAAGVSFVSTRTSSGVAARTFLLALVPGLAVLAIAYVPLLQGASGSRWYEEVFLYSLFELPDWRNLEYVRPAYWDLLKGFQTLDGNLFIEGFLRLGFAVLPFVAVIFGGAFAAYRLIGSKAAMDRSTALALVLSIMTLLLLNQMRVRPTITQCFPAFVASMPLGAYLVRVISEGAASWGVRAQTAARVAGFVSVVVVGVALVTVASKQYVVALNGDPIGGAIPRARWVRAPTHEGARQRWIGYGELVRYIQESTSTNEPIFSGVRDTSRLYVNDVMLYFLAHRPPAVRSAEMEPGITNTWKGQREVVESIERKGVRTVVLWDHVSSEPNRTAVSNGVHILDEFVRANFEEVRRFGNYSVWRRRTESGGTPAGGA